MESADLPAAAILAAAGVDPQKKCEWNDGKRQLFVTLLLPEIKVKVNYDSH